MQKRVRATQHSCARKRDICSARARGWCVCVECLQRMFRARFVRASGRDAIFRDICQDFFLTTFWRSHTVNKRQKH